MFLRGFFERRSADEPDVTSSQSWWGDLFGGRMTASGERVTESTALLNSNVYTCAAILGGDIGKLPIQVFKRKGVGVTKDTSHPVARLLGVQSNPYMTAYIFKELMQVHQAVWGNAYAWIEWDESGYPKALWPLDPARTEVKVDTSTGEVWYSTVTGNGQAWKLPPHDVLHFKSISRNGLQGISPISVIREELGVQQAQKKFIGSFYSNGTTTRGILKTSANQLLKPEAREAVRNEWQAANSGQQNAFKVAVLETGWDYESLGMPLADAQFIETSKFGIAEVAKIYKIPPHKLGQLDRATFNNIEQQSLDYVKNTLTPICTNHEQEIVIKLFTAQEQKKYYVKYNMAAELRGDSQSRADYFEKMIRMGVYSINNVLELDERDGIGELGDRHYISLNYVPLEKQDEYQMAKAKSGSPKGGENKDDDKE